MTEPAYNLSGALPQPADARDRDFALLAQLLPQETANDTDACELDETSPVSDQGGLGSCWANAGCDSIELLSPNPVQLSRLHLYQLCLTLDGNPCLDVGTYGRTVMRVASKLGICSEAAWPYDITKFAVRPPLLALQEAFQHLITGYYAIQAFGALKGEQIRQAIRAKHPVPHASDIDQLYIDCRNDKALPPIDGRVAGSHAMVWVGYRRNDAGGYDYKSRGSWGRRLGDRGHVWMSEQRMWLSHSNWVPTQAWAA